MSIAIHRGNAIRQIAGGIAAVGIKELRGRMRGRRAFVLLTIHLLAVAGFAFFVEEIAVRSVSSTFGGGPQSADIGRGLFDAVLVFLTIIVLILAPASTSGAISLEREKQTLDMLVTTPVSSLAIVLGKLVAALGWIALLLFASIPVMALVFMFGGVGPEDLLRAYVVLGASAILYGSLGLFISALFKRTQASTVLNLVLALVFTGGTGGTFAGLTIATVTDAQSRGMETNVPVDWSKVQGPPTAMLLANPFAAATDVMCHAEAAMGGTCFVDALIMGRLDIASGSGRGALMANGQGFEMPQDSYWPVSVAAMLVLSMALIAGTTQLISPTRRWRRPRRGRGMAAQVAAAMPAPTAPPLVAEPGPFADAGPLADHGPGPAPSPGAET